MRFAPPRWPIVRRRASTLAWGILALLAVALSAPGLRTGIENSMVLHMLVQMPLLWAAGGGLMAGIDPGARLGARFDMQGLSSFSFCLVVVSYWMLPSAIDRAVLEPGFDAIKVASLLACGASLRQAVMRAPAVVRLFFLGYLLQMTLWLGLYWAFTEERLCNVYSLSTQQQAGAGLAALAVALGAVFVWRLARAAASGPEATGSNP
ncbi:MAG: hypothetical protein DI596_02905 [Azospira oryzae]|nr:MAG: hypothetical protein DI596_02905 [Azospira oryzae]PZP81994.1 MAG: hypothetical protein DI593_02905 [Azospira oryzae]